MLLASEIFSVKIEMWDFRLSAQVSSAKLPHRVFCLCSKQLSFSLQLQVLFILVSGKDLKDLNKKN